jgi:V8-like Glu-specific endopeptidase
MRKVTFGAAAVFAGVFACGNAGPGEELGKSGEEIVGGAVDNGHPTVARLALETKDAFGNKGTGTCTGTLVSPTVIVSAAHCVRLTGSYGLEMKLTKATAFFGTDATAAAPAALKPIKEWHAHPSYDRSVTSPNDIAVFILASPESTAASPINRSPLSGDSVGKAVTSVGFGLTKGGASETVGIKRQVTTSLVSLASNGKHFSYGKAGATTCQGDSGGPELMTLGGKETLVGVTSYGPGPCESGSATAVRVDAHLDFLDKYLGGGGTAPPPDAGAPTPAPDAGGGGGGTTSYQCCINGDCYKCPDKASQDKCVGFDLSACFAACGSNFACFSDCQAKASASPKDPSGCVKQ